MASLLSLLGSLLTNRAGQFALIALAVWAWTAHNTSSYWRGVIAQEKAAVEAAYKAEVARQAAAAKEIAAAASARAEDDARAVSDMQKVISEYQSKLKEQSHVSSANRICRFSACVVDDHFGRVVRKLSDAGRRKAKATKPARKIRKARPTPAR